MNSANTCFILYIRNHFIRNLVLTRPSIIKETFGTKIAMPIARYATFGKPPFFINYLLINVPR